MDSWCQTDDMLSTEVLIPVFTIVSDQPNICNRICEKGSSTHSQLTKFGDS